MRRPHILLLYTDQQRWDALGANGNGQIQTPNLDRLAEQGCNFSQYFVQNPVCMPSRISFLSGQYPSTLGITHMGVPVPQDLPTLPRLLKPYGYTCANIGKLHFLPHANRDHRVPHPAYGFDHLEISDEPGPYEDAYRAWARRQDPDQLDRLSVGLPPTAAEWYRLMGVKDGVEHPQEGGRFDFKGAVPFAGGDGFTHTAFVAEQTIEYIRRQQAGPFLCIAGFYSPHAPWVVPQTYLDRYNPAAFALPEFPPALERQRRAGQITDDQLRSARHGYYAMVTEVDHHVGRILDCLEEEGMAEDTLVVFTSDHGEWLGEHLRYGKGAPGPDCVSRVPCIWRGPSALIEPGTVCDDIVEAVDVVPTLLEAAGIQVPPTLQGTSLVGALGGGRGGRGAALMEGAGWKTLRTPGFRYRMTAAGTEELWDLEADPGEYHNVASEAAYAGTLAAHRQALLKRLIDMERPRDRVWTY